ncbi:MAG: hypothetical protein IPG87_19720 [Saprospiraceae bacterium]|nr:hypothetical protein [Candidatus Vicinibacter affinis]
MDWRWEAEWRQGDGVQWQVPQKYTVLLLVCLFDSNLENRALDCSLHLQSTNTSHQPISVSLSVQCISFIDRQTAQIDQSVMASIGLLQSASTLDQTPKWTSQRQSRK